MVMDHGDGGCMEVVWKGSGGKQTTARNTDVGQTEASDPGAGQTGAVYVTVDSSTSPLMTCHVERK